MLNVRKWITLEFALFAVVLIFLLGVNVWYVTGQVSHGQHDFCAIASTRSIEPPPPIKNPSKDYLAYSKKVTSEYRALKEKLGCLFIQP